MADLGAFTRRVRVEELELMWFLYLKEVGVIGSWKKGRLILGEAYFTFKAVCESKGDFRGSGTDILLTESLLASRSTIVKYHKMVYEVNL